MSYCVLSIIESYLLFVEVLELVQQRRAERCGERYLLFVGVLEQRKHHEQFKAR